MSSEPPPAGPSPNEPQSAGPQPAGPQPGAPSPAGQPPGAAPQPAAPYPPGQYPGGSYGAGSVAGPGRFFDPVVLNQPYEGEMWTKYLSIGGLVLTLLSLIAPWWSAGVGAFSANWAGYREWPGAITMLFLGAGGAVVWIPRNWTALAMGIVGCVTVLMAFIGLTYGHASWGLVLAFLGGAGTAVGGAAVIFGFGARPGY